jgi:hypothetical protein
MRSLDSLFLEVADKISFIKCDVEGHELAVVSGGSEVFREIQAGVAHGSGGGIPMKKARRRISCLIL